MINYIFVLDNNIFSSSLLHIPFSIFTDLYFPWSNGMKEGYLISVEEVFKELMVFFQKNKDKYPSEYSWLQNHKNAFKGMTRNDSTYVRKILNDNKFREGVKPQSILQGLPQADAILVAKAKTVNGIIITEESSIKPNSDRIPNICAKFDIPCFNLYDFYKIIKENLFNNADFIQNLIAERKFPYKR
ncbi:MAG: DUF4411 family protein [Deltaproteobacteria bacterium]|jgi:hypothetical protein|nr:DUF4411 family protein [Deltaproteobacteria bacterium]